MAIITKKQLEQMLPQNKNIKEWHAALNKILPQYNITTIKRMGAFIAQCSHESGQFTRLEENLNYKASRLVEVFPKYFPSLELAKLYESQPEKIANRIYANRMGNGSETSGDGYKFRGRGLIQLTGKTNYQHFADSVNLTIDQAIEYMYSFEGCVQSAADFWERNKLNQFADSGDFITLTKRINGGTIGLKDREEQLELAMSVLRAKPTVA